MKPLAGRLTATGLVMSLALSLGVVPAAADSSPSALPVTVTPATGHGDTLAVFYSGDGGWVASDVGMTADLVKAGVPVVGVNSLRYFVMRKTPEESAADLAALLRRDMSAWGKTRIVLGGYSFGASALALIVPHLPADLRSHIRLIALVDPATSGELQFWPGDWLNVAARSATPIAPALAKLKGIPMICISGADEPDAACLSLASDHIRSVRVPGGHHYGGHYEGVSRAILAALPR